MRKAIGGVLAAALLLGGCASAPYAVDRDADATLVTATSSPGVRMQALITGELAIVGDGCFGLVTTDGSEYATVFPVGTTVEEATLDIPGLGLVELGDTIEGGGGMIGFENIPEECKTEEVASLNPFDD